MNQTIATIASGHPLIDIDLTAVVQFVLFLLLMAICNKLLFQPYLALRERRKAGVEGARAEAERMTATADAKLADFEKQLATARDRANEEGRKVRAEAGAIERDATEKARTAAQTSINEATTKMRSDTEAARKELMPQADAIARSIASRLLGREVA